VKLTKDILKQIHTTNDFNLVFLFITKIEKKKNDWLPLITNISLLKIILINNLFDKIELLLNLGSTSDRVIISETLEGISNKTITELYQNNIISEELYVTLIDIKPPSKRSGKFNWKSKKKEKKKAVSLWLTAFAVIILVIQLLFFLLMSLKLLLF
jgi:hypothetical protein